MVSNFHFVTHISPLEPKDIFPDLSLLQKYCYVTQMFCSHALRDLQWSTALNWLWLDQKEVLVHRRLDGICKLPWLHYHVKFSDSYSAGHNFCHVQRSLEDCMCPSCTRLPLKIFASFLEPWWHMYFLLFKTPFLPFLWGEGIFRIQALPSLFLDQWIKFVLCYAEPDLFDLHLFLQVKDPLRGHGPIANR